MIDLKIDKAKKFFFDTPRVMKAVDEGTRKALSKFGAFVRTRAKSSIRTSKKISEPGQPPKSHTGLLKRFIYFAYEPVNRSVVIGPTLLNQKTSRTALPALEYGGMTTVSAGRRLKHKRRVRIEARPFMNPAFEKELKQVPELLKNSVK
jgi:hypothetical protein